MKLSLFSLLALLSFSFTIKDLKPLLFLKDNNELILIKNSAFVNSSDTLNEMRTLELSSLSFEQKNFKVENYGVTPDYSISVMKEGYRIALISVWKIDTVKLAININHFADKFYHGYVIDRKKFESIFRF